MKNLLSFSAICLALCLPITTMASTEKNALFSLHNLERERSALLTELISNTDEADQKQQKVQALYRRLADLERMVLRDERVANSGSRVAKKALEQYELTFIIHAASEHNMLPIDHWLQEVGINTQSIMHAKAGAR
ncbi:hypothetical protein QX776_03250 [Alteromonadaceae bacterium BrNp21-10]|nr:hypothetical protein [Alteromonadaceae bacterium BrNp21-10]